MQTGPEKQMISMFEEAIELSSQFKKATYEPTFRSFEKTPGACRMLKRSGRRTKEGESSSFRFLEQRFGVCKRAASYKLSDKRKRENRILDYNLALVTFLFHCCSTAGIPSWRRWRTR